MTTVIRFADARLAASIVINNSIRWSFAGGEVDWIIKISSPKIQNNEQFVLSGKDSLVISMSAAVGGSVINKRTTYYGNSYLIKHAYDVLPGPFSVSNYNDFNFSWFGGIRNTEKDRAFETSQYTQAYLAQNKSIEDFYITPEVGDVYRSVDFRGKTDWAAIRNKYFSVIQACVKYILLNLLIHY